jgi:uncharacterized damage-inducible protein DinB
MEALLQLYARYNMGVTDALAGPLDTLPHAELSAAHRTHYQSIHRLYHHLSVGSCHYLAAVRNLSGGR